LRVVERERELAPRGNRIDRRAADETALLAERHRHDT
jgi:hypothetical protein